MNKNWGSKTVPMDLPIKVGDAGPLGLPIKVGNLGRWVLPIAILASLILAGCGGGRTREPVFCGDRRIELALAAYDQAREHLSIHYRNRSDSSLGSAYRSSQDSVFLARATRSCYDFDEVMRRQAINLIKTNLLFQKLVASNMRDQDPGVVIDLYGPRYREIFKNDIQ